MVSMEEGATSLLIGAARRLFEEKFGSSSGSVVVFAPGRVNLIGEHTDYNDGFVMPLALSLKTVVVGRGRISSKGSRDTTSEHHSRQILWKFCLHTRILVCNASKMWNASSNPFTLHISEPRVSGTVPHGISCSTETQRCSFLASRNYIVPGFGANSLLDEQCSERHVLLVSLLWIMRVRG